MNSILQNIFDGILEGDRQTVQDNVQAGLNQGLEPKTILNESMISAMAEVGRLFEQGEYYVPEMLIAARAMKEGLALLKPHLAGDQSISVGSVIIGTVQGDLHDIGKNLVAMMLEGAGFEITDLGTDVSPDEFVVAVRQAGAQRGQTPVVAMSALLTTTMTNMRKTITALEEAGLREQVKVIIGGAPVTDDYAREIGADGFATDASRAVTLAKGLLNF